MTPTAQAAPDLEADRAFRVAFAHVPGIGPRTYGRLVGHFGSGAAAWRASRPALARSVGPARSGAIIDAREHIDPAGLLASIVQSGIDVLVPSHTAYPPLLATISSPPLVLFVRGRSELLSTQPAIAIVGTRRMTVYGRRATAEIAADLASSGVTIVSGMAAGIDTVAHQTTLDCGGATVAVLGGGVDIAYPKRNAGLLRRLADEGAVVSEVPPGVPPVPGNFPARNRIIAGLSLGTLVVEAGRPSGALITADSAASEGREVWVVPGPIFQSSSLGCHHLARHGACLIRGAHDVLRDLANIVGAPATGHSLRPVAAMRVGDATDANSPEAPWPADPNSAAVQRALALEPLHVDDLAGATGLSASQVTRALSALELDGSALHLGAMVWALVDHEGARARPAALPLFRAAP